MPWAYPTGTYYAKTVAVPGFFNELYNNMPCNVSRCAHRDADWNDAGRDDGRHRLRAGSRRDHHGHRNSRGYRPPLAGVTVSVYSSNGTAVGSATTNASGVYTTTGLAAGTYYIQTSNGLGYIDEVYNNLLCNGGSCPSVTTGTGVSVTQGAATSGIDFSLAVGGSITGPSRPPDVACPWRASTSSSTTPAAPLWGGVHERVWGVHEGRSARGTYYVRTSTASGTSTRCTTTFDAMEGVPVGHNRDRRGVTLGAPTGGIDFSLAVGGSITGTVTAAGSGMPLSGVRVYVYNSVGTSTQVGVYELIGGIYTAGPHDGHLLPPHVEQPRLCRRTQ